MKIRRDNWEGDPDFLEQHRHWLKAPSLTERIWDKIATLIEKFFKALFNLLLSIIRGIPWAPVLLAIGVGAVVTSEGYAHRWLDTSIALFLYGAVSHIAWIYSDHRKTNSTG